MSWFTNLFRRVPKPVIPAPAMPTPANIPHTEEYLRLWDTMKVDPGKEGVVRARVQAIAAGRARYEAITRRTAVPWPIIGILHNMECGLDFGCHLHNGDRLTRRTHQVPAGRPVKGSPPFSFEDSAVDALEYDKLTTWNDWSVEGCLYKLEGFNGFGYRKVRNPDGSRGTDNPYLWAFSNHCDEIGKFVADGKFDPDAPTKQVGVALLLKGLWGQL